MSGVEVSGGGSIAVDTDAMLRAGAVLAAARDLLDGVFTDLAALAADPAWPATALPARMRATEAVEAAAAAVRIAGDVETALHTAALRYGTVEEVVARSAATAGALTATAWGGLLRHSHLVGPAAPALLTVVTAAGALEVVSLLAARQWLTEGRVDLANDPAAIGVLRLLVGSADDAARGFTGTATPGDLLADDPEAPLGTEALGAAAAAALAVAHAADPRVRVERRGAAIPVRAPASLADLARRLPPGGPGRSQVRVERYGSGASARSVVYIAGTQSFALDSGTEPFDMTSNLLAVADRTSASEAAVLQAMQAAGVAEGEPVLLVGHSQGALVASRIAEDGSYDVAGVVTLGGPTGRIDLPPELPVLAVEHAEDPVPALGGTLAGDLDRVVVRRRLYDDAPPPDDRAVPAHAVREYTRTLELAQASGAERITSFERGVAPFLAGTGTATLWRADRATGTPREPERTRAVSSRRPR